MASGSIGPVNIQVGVDSSQLKSGMAGATTQVEAAFSRVNVDSFAGGLDKKLTKQFAQMRLKATPEFSIKSAAIAEAEESARKALRVATARSKFGGAGAFAAQVGNVFEEVGEIASTFAPLLTPVGLALAGAAIVTGVAVKAFHSMISFASLADPEAAKRYSKAWERLNQTIGRVFVPVLDMAIKVVDGIGDALNVALPTANDMRAAFAGFNPILGVFRDTIVGLGVVFRAAIEPSLQFAKQISGIIETMNKIVPREARGPLAGAQVGGGLGAVLGGPLGPLGGILGSVFGGLVGAAGTLGARVPKAGETSTGQASFVGIGDLAEKAQLAAFSGEGAPMQQVAANTTTTNTLLEQIARGLVVRILGGGGGIIGRN